METFYYPWQLKEMARQKAAAARSKRRAGKAKPKELVIQGVTKEGPMYTVAVDISVDKLSYSQPLTAAKPSTFYWVRATITQHVGNPMIQGFKVLWKAPTGWVWADGVGTYSFEEAISNPLTIVRKVKSPLVLNTVSFSATVSDYYL